MTDTARAEVRSQRRAARRAESRTEILDAAERVFSEDGLRDGSLRRIGDLSGYSTAAIYKFFDSKQHFVAQVLNRRADEYLVELRQAAGSAGTPLERLHHIADTRPHSSGRGHTSGRCYGSAGRLSHPRSAAGRLRRGCLRPLRHAISLMTDLIRQGQQVAEIRTGDPGGLAHLASVLTNEFALADVALPGGLSRGVRRRSARGPDVLTPSRPENETAG